MYTYKAIVKRIIDADTLVVAVDLGFDLWLQDQTMRLARINAPEIRGTEKKAGYRSLKRVRELLAPGTPVIISTQKKDSFGRWIAEIFINRENLSDLLVKEGFADYETY